MDKQESFKAEELEINDEEKNDRENEAEKTSMTHRILSIAGIIISALILPVLILNIVFLVQSYLHPDEVPGIFGITPMVVVTDSMDPVIAAGDMIVDKKIEPEEVRVGDIISFFDPTREDNDVVITHRVTAIYSATGKLSFATKGDANNVADPLPVPAEKIVGIYRRTIPVIGEVVLFMKTPAGVFCTVILPILLLVAYDLIRKRIAEKQKEKDSEMAAAASVEGVKSLYPKGKGGGASK